MGGLLMSIHGFIDSAAVGLGAKLMPKYFRDGCESETVAENLKHISIDFPEIAGKRDYELFPGTLVGELNAAFRLAQWVGGSLPTVIYHHGASETPFDYGFKGIFPLHKQQIAVNFFLVRAPFHRNMKDFKQGIRTLANVVAMLAVSVRVIEHLVQHARKVGDGKVLVAGPSLGGFITNLHHIHFNSADYYTPLLAGLAMDDAYLYSTYSKATAREARDNPAAIKAVLNFEQEFAARDHSNVFPLLAAHDRLIRYEKQKASYGNCPVETMAKGHTTGALAYAQLRSHILNRLQKTGKPGKQNV